MLPHVRYIEVEKGAGEMPEHFTGVVFSNEFFDALPVHVARFDQGQWIDRLVGAGEQGLVWVDGGPCAPPVAEYLRRNVSSPAQGQIVEVSLEALDWLRRIAGALERGFVLTIDYGYTAEEIAGGKRFPQGSLMSYRRHQAYEDVLCDPGGLDITAHVNFAALAARGEELDLRPSPLQTQAQFLLSIGGREDFQTAVAGDTEQQIQRHRLLLKTLLAGMGETFRVLVQQKA